MSSKARACIDAIPIPAPTNEMGHFPAAFKSLMQAYRKSDLFKVISYDAGACCAAHGQLVENNRHYLFGLKGSQPTLQNEAKALLGGRQPHEAETVDVESNTRTVTRRLYRASEMAGYLDWTHLKQHEDRYFISSLASEVLSAAQWLLVVRRHWAVENNCHHTWDTVFEEDDRPWIEKNPQGMVVVMLLRRIAYNIAGAVPDRHPALGGAPAGAVAGHRPLGSTRRSSPRPTRTSPGSAPGRGPPPSCPESAGLRSSTAERTRARRGGTSGSSETWRAGARST